MRKQENIGTPVALAPVCYITGICTKDHCLYCLCSRSTCTFPNPAHPRQETRYWKCVWFCSGTRCADRTCWPARTSRPGHHHGWSAAFRVYFHCLHGRKSGVSPNQSVANVSWRSLAFTVKKWKFSKTAFKESQAAFGIYFFVCEETLDMYRKILLNQKKTSS